MTPDFLDGIPRRDGEWVRWGRWWFHARLLEWVPVIAGGALYTNDPTRNTDALTTTDPTSPQPQDATDAATGVAATGAAGTAVPSTTVAESGVAATSGQGTALPVHTVSGSGVAATGGRGSLTPANTHAATGASATGNRGTVTPNVTVALTGVGGATAVGSLRPATARLLVGVPATGSRGTLSPANTHALTGSAATAAVGTVTPHLGTRFKLPTSAMANDVSPAAQSYTHTPSPVVRARMPRTWPEAPGVPSLPFRLNNLAYSPDAGTHLGAGDALNTQWVSDPMDAGLVFTSGDGLRIAVQSLETSGNNNLQVQLFVSVVSLDGLTVRATLRSKVLQGSEVPITTAAERYLLTSLSGSYTTVAGDRLVVEVSLSGTPTAQTTGNHNGSIRRGYGGTSGDLPDSSTSTVTTLDPWVEFLHTAITFQIPLSGSARTSGIGTVSANITVALTGVGATAGLGLVVPVSSRLLIGVEATSHRGSVGSAHTNALSGVGGNGHLGDVIEGDTDALTGVEAVGSVGTVRPSTTRALTGAGATGDVGTVSESEAEALSGVSAVGQLGNVSVHVTIDVIGVGAGTDVGDVQPHAPVRRHFGVPPSVEKRRRLKPRPRIVIRGELDVVVAVATEVTARIRVRGHITERPIARVWSRISAHLRSIATAIQSIGTLAGTAVAEVYLHSHLSSSIEVERTWVSGRLRLTATMMTEIDPPQLAATGSHDDLALERQRREEDDLLASLLGKR